MEKQEKHTTDDRTRAVTLVSVVLDQLEILLNWFLLELQFFPVYP